MKNSDIALIILIAAGSLVGAYFIGNWVLGDVKDETKKVVYMDEISSDVEMPDENVFNPYMLNPTVEVYVGKCRSGFEWDNGSKTCVNIDTGDTEEAQDGQNDSEE